MTLRVSSTSFKPPTTTPWGYLSERDTQLEHFSAPGASVARVNRLEVRPEYIRIHGLAFEEYLIEAVTG
jgi:hypothetical protein